jgi:hypothetical protein
MLKRLATPLLALFVIAVGVSVASAQNGHWRKLGEKDVDFNIDHDHIIARDKGHIREIHLAVRYAPVNFRRVVINYKDGTKQEVEFLENVALGHESRSINIVGDGHVIDSVDMWYETASLGGKKAKVTVYGKS